jgi:outer membrane protein assembly factor BamD
LLRLFLITLLLSGAGCSTTPDDPYADMSANDLYAYAKKALDDGDYETAINAFEKLEARYPFGKYAQQAQLEIAYAYYKFDEPDSAIATLDRFIRNNPGHAYIDYAYYLKGLVNYTRGASIIDRLSRRDPSDRDARALRDAFNDFSELVKKYPESKYSEDAKYRLVYLHNIMAQYEVSVAAYYMKRGAYVAAANRAKYVVENYQRTPAVTEALRIMVRAYTNLGMDSLADDARRVINANPTPEQ